MPIRRNRRSRVKSAAEQKFDPFDLFLAEQDETPGLIRELIGRNVPDIDAIRKIEQREIFNPNQSPNLGASYDPNAGPASHALVRRTISAQCAEEFELAARWFAWRGYPELSARYSARAQVAHQILSQKERDKS